MSGLDSLKAALAVRIAAEEECALADQRAAEFRVQAEAARRALAEFARAAADRDADAVAAGQKLPEPPLAETRRMAALQREAEAATAAAVRVGAERATMAERQRAAQSGVADQGLATSGELRNSASAEVLTGLESLAPHLGLMIAAHRLRDRLLGERFEFDGSRFSAASLYDGATVARALVKGLPARLRPEGYAARVEAAADAAFVHLLADLGLGS